MMSANAAMHGTLHEVAILVNTAGVDTVATLCDVTEKLRKEQGRRLAAARRESGYRSARDAALSNNWPESTYRAHESGMRTIGQDDAERYARRYRAAGAKISAAAILFGADDEGEPDAYNDERSVVPIMGYIGAGAEIEPDFEQVPPEGLDQVALPFGVPEDMIGFQVRGDSMLPKYDDGDVVVVPREQRRATDSLIGEDAAVRIYVEEGSRRFLKRIMPGPKRHTFNLESTNARTIVGARIAWASEIWAIVPAGRLRTIAKKPARAAPGLRAELGRQR